MHRRDFVSLGAAAVAGAVTARHAGGQQAGHPAAARLGAPPLAVRDGLVWDAMGELRPEYDDALVRDMLASGLDAITITLCDPKPEGDEAFRLAMDALLAHDRWLASRPDRFVRARRVADVDLARRTGRLAVWYLYQNSAPIGDNLDRVDLFARLGVRSLQLTYNTRNAAGVGCWEEGGLTPFGRALVARLNAQGVLLDLSHANMRTMADATAASTKPVIVSHTACMAVHENRRNTTDENLRAVATRGGVVGICQMRPFLTTARGAEAMPAYWAHLRHAIRTCGVEHVAIGSDRDHRVITLSPEYLAELRREEGSQVVDRDLPYFVDELNGPRRMEVVRRGLAGLGLTAREVDLVLGGNLRRLYADVVG